MAVKDILKNIGTAVRTGRVPYNYKVGTPSTGKSLPFDVKLSIDKDFEKAVTKWVAIGATGIGLGIAAGIIISKKRRS
jgi:hypothetical protein